jgi:hypothetical protein
MSNAIATVEATSTYGGETFTYQRVTIAEYEIPEQNIARLEKAIAALNRKARRLGSDAITLVRLGTVVREMWYTALDVEGRPYDRKGKFLLHTVRIEGTEPRLNGWGLAAVLEGTEAGTLVKGVPGVELPARYQTADPKVCEHCGKRRARAFTYVLRHEDGRFMQVGKSCLKDFLGGLDPHTIAAYAEGLNQLASGDWGSGRGERVWGTEQFIAWVIAAIPHTGGYKTRAEAGPQATGSVASHYMYIDAGETKADDYDMPLWQPTAEDSAHAVTVRAEALAVIAAKPARSDYEHNLYTLLSMDDVSPRHFGIVASAWGYLHREREYVARQAAKAAKPEALNEWAGEVGKRETFALTFLGGQTFDSEWGSKTLLRFADAEGRAFTWWCSGYFDLDAVTEGTAYSVKATVKAHNDYKGTRQTVLSRAVIGDEVTR